MKNFAYNLHQHKDVIRKTHKENWYSEDMFTRFIITASIGTIKGSNVFKSILQATDEDK